MISKTMRAILHALSYSNVEVDAARKLADLKKLDAMRIFLKKLDTKVYNGDHEVPVRLYFPDEEAMKTEMSQGLLYPILLFFHGGGWVTDSVDNYERICARLAVATEHMVISVEYRLAPEHKKIRTRLRLWATAPAEIWLRQYVCLPEPEESLCQKDRS